MAKIEGSKEVSGGTDNKHVFEENLNGAPHVDEDVTFDFDPAFSVLASSVEVLLSDFDSTDIIYLSILLTDNQTLTYKISYEDDPSSAPYADAFSSSFIKELNSSDKLWSLTFYGLAQLSNIALIDSFTIRANDDYFKENKDGDIDNSPRGTAEHFLINGLNAEYSPVPIPGAVWLLGSGLIGLAGIRRRFRK